MFDALVQQKRHLAGLVCGMATLLCRMSVYLAECLHSYKPQRHLGSSSLNLFTVRYGRTELDRRRFSVAVPRVWTSLPTGL